MLRGAVKRIFANGVDRFGIPASFSLGEDWAAV